MPYNSCFARARTAVDTQWGGFPLQELPERGTVKKANGKNLARLLWLVPELLILGLVLFLFIFSYLELGPD